MKKSSQWNVWGVSRLRSLAKNRCALFLCSRCFMTRAFGDANTNLISLLLGLIHVMIIKVNSFRESLVKHAQTRAFEMLRVVKHSWKSNRFMMNNNFFYVFVSPRLECYCQPERESRVMRVSFVFQSIELKSLAQTQKRKKIKRFKKAPSFSNIPLTVSNACAEECMHPSDMMMVNKREKERRKETETEDDERNQNIELKCIRNEIKEL